MASSVAIIGKLEPDNLGDRTVFFKQTDHAQHPLARHAASRNSTRVHPILSSESAAARQLIAQLGLEPLALEGGFFRVTSRTASASAILYLLTEQDFSALHRLKQDEMWHFYAGDPVDHVQFDPAGARVRVTRISSDLALGSAPQVFVPAGTWQGAWLAASPAHGSGPSRPRHGYALLGCTVAPPFDPNGFELLGRADALRDFPGHAALIQSLTR